MLLVNTNKLPVNSVQEIVAEAKKTPGRINYATPGLGSPFHLATELLSQGAGIKLTHVPYRGAAPAVQDLVAGQVDMMFIDFATARSQISGPIQAVAVASPQEFPGLPGVPPVAAHHQGFEAWAWQGFVAPAGTPPEIVAKLNETYRRVVANPEIRAKLDRRPASTCCRARPPRWRPICRRKAPSGIRSSGRPTSPWSEEGTSIAIPAIPPIPAVAVLAVDGRLRLDLPDQRLAGAGRAAISRMILVRMASAKCWRSRTGTRKAPSPPITQLL